jgi:hypothetical protein
MNIEAHWPAIQQHFDRSFRSSFHVSLATVGAENTPTVTPIGSLFLYEDQPSGFYFEKFPFRIRQHMKFNQRVCVLAVNSSWWLWAGSLIRGKFGKYPAIRLYGEFGGLRPATDHELGRLRGRMRLARGTKGRQYLWGDVHTVRDIHFYAAEMVNLGKMTKDLPG